MSDLTIVPFAEGEAKLDWTRLTEALAAGHRLPKAQVEDVLMRRGQDTLLNRSAWIEGMGLAVKCATIFGGNPAKGRPLIGGAVTLYDDEFGALEALVDFHLVTKWKTAGDSLLAARRLARPDSAVILICGAGTVGRSLHAAYGAAFPQARFLIWNRSPEGAERFAAETGAEVAPDLEAAVGRADIVTSATMTSAPILRGDWFRPGQHIDLIGAYRPDMREADDAAMRRARVFCDSRETTVHHIGEFRDPIASGALREADIVADFYELERFERRSPDEITLFKNGGGAHLDLMTARYILDAWRG